MVFDHNNVTTASVPTFNSSYTLEELDEKLASCNQTVAVLAIMVMFTMIGVSISTVGWIHSCIRNRKLSHKDEKQGVDLKQDILQEVDHFEAMMLNKHRAAWCVCRTNMFDKLIRVDDQYYVTALHVLGYLCRGSGVLTDTSPMLFYLGDKDVRRQDIQSLLKEMRDVYIKLKHLISKYTLGMGTKMTPRCKTNRMKSDESHRNILSIETYKHEFLREAAKIFVSLDFDGNNIIIEEVCLFFDIQFEDLIGIGEREINKYLPYSDMMSLENETLDIIYPLESRLKMDIEEREIVEYLEELEFSCSRSKRYLECAQLDSLYASIVQLCDTYGFIEASMYNKITVDTMKVMYIKHMVRLLLHNIFEAKMKNASRQILYANDVRNLYDVYDNTECDTKEVIGAKCERVCAEIRQGVYFICSNTHPELLNEEMLVTLRANEREMSDVIRKAVQKK